MAQSGFVAGTLVHTDKGLVPIEQIKVGDMVLSKHESGKGTQDYKHVTKTLTTEEAIILQISYANILNPMDEIQARLLYLGSDHLIWAIKNNNEEPINAWIAAQHFIESGLEMMLANGSAAGCEIWEVLETNNPNVAYVYDCLNDAPEILVDFSKHKIQTYDLQSEGYTFSNETLPADFDSQIVKDYLDFFETQGYPDVYKATTYNISVADYHTYYVGTEGIWVHALP